MYFILIKTDQSLVEILKKTGSKIFKLLKRAVMRLDKIMILMKMVILPLGIHNIIAIPILSQAVKIKHRSHNLITKIKIKSIQKNKMR